MREAEKKIIDGKKIASNIEFSLAQNVAFLKKNGIIPCIAVILVGEDPASILYVKNKENSAKRCGVLSQKYTYPSTVSQKILLNKIEELNDDLLVQGILVQLPLPAQINEHRVMETINPDKDVDGFHPFNAGKIFTDNSSFYPCTPLGIMKMLDYSNISLEGKNAVIIGQSNIVGKPLSIMLMNRNATVSSLNIYTRNIKCWTKKADILISATGKPHLINESFVKEGAVVIDVGITKLNGKICGDVNFDNVLPKASMITPVPGGVGPVTVSVLMENTVNAALKSISKQFYKNIT